MDQDHRRRLRHDLRGNWNGVRLSLVALSVSKDRREIIEFLDMLAQSAQDVSDTVDKILILNDIPEE